MRYELILVHFRMLSIASKNKHVYDRWKYIVTCMIEKHPGCPNIHRLRVIHLYECGLNLMFALFFRELDQHCEDTKLLNDGAYGSCPNRRAIDPVIVDVTKT